MCGADGDFDLTGIAGKGSPPRVRSRRALQVFERAGPGITSACAEQTPTRTATMPCSRDHLRVCGADEPDALGDRTVVGSPPRVRSRLSLTRWIG